MKIFISWSGNRSRVFAQEFTKWIQGVLQAAKPWISTEDIPSGSLWFSKISEQLSSTSTGILCLTKENLQSKWIMFEFGALYKGLEANRLHTILIDLEPNDIVENPLTQLNHTPAPKGIRKLIHDLNRQMGEHAISTETLDRVLDLNMPEFEKLHAKAMVVQTDQEQEKANDVSEKDMLAELLSLVRSKHVLQEMAVELVDDLKDQKRRKVMQNKIMTLTGALEYFRMHPSDSRREHIRLMMRELDKLTAYDELDHNKRNDLLLRCEQVIGLD